MLKINSTIFFYNNEIKKNNNKVKNKCRGSKAEQ